jgi:protein-tyrosine phosphatase
MLPCNIGNTVRYAAIESPDLSGKKMNPNGKSNPQRQLPLAGAENVRDLGGYTTTSGQITQFHRFVRSGDLHSLSLDDQQALLDYGIKSVIDLRMSWEIKAQPNVFHRSSMLDFRIHDFWGNRFDDYRSINKTAPPARKLADLYCRGLELSGFVMAEIMHTFAETKTGYLFHCRSGKDRTGLVAAMLLAIAGVSDNTICQDFALTQQYLKTGATNPIAASAPGAWQKTCEPETMQFTLDFLTDHYGGAVSYLQHFGLRSSELQRIKDSLTG